MKKHIGLVAVIIILLIVDFMGFFANVRCDIDKVNLACRLHPLTSGDVFGLLLFHAGALLLGGITKLFGVNLMNPTGSAFWPIVSFGAMALGMILIWNT